MKVRNTMWDEFKKFIAAGNVIDLAVGVLIGGLFGKIVTSFVEDLINPFLGLLTKVDLSNLYVPITPTGVEKVKAAIDAGTPMSLAAAKAANIPVMAIGNFLSVVINTLILAFIIFLVVKGINKMREKMKKEAEVAPAAPAAPPADVQLLTEIRDLLKK
jgi:large conductance mechanosensitive channel